MKCLIGYCTLALMSALSSSHAGSQPLVKPVFKNDGTILCGSKAFTTVTGKHPAREPGIWPMLLLVD